MQLSPHDIECIYKAKQIIDQDSSVHFHISDLAQKVGVGSTKLKSGFKLMYGMGLYEYLKEERLQKAMLMLSGTDKTIKQISKAIGFKHTRNFITAVKKRFGNSPGKLKND